MDKETDTVRHWCTLKNDGKSTQRHQYRGPASLPFLNMLFHLCLIVLACLLAVASAVPELSALPEAAGLQAGLLDSANVTATLSTDVIVSGAQYGYDISQALSSSSASCLNSNGYIFAAPRGYRSTGAVDTAVCNSIKTAYNAGAKVRDTYLFPCKYTLAIYFMWT
jgi:hypothetical protein